MRLASLLALALSLHVAHAGAQPAEPTRAELAEARREFELGSAAYDAGRFDEALERFRRAHQLTRSPDLLYNIAAVLDRLRRDEEALATYEQYLELRPDAEDRANVEARIAVLRASIERARIDRQIADGAGEGEDAREGAGEDAEESAASSDGAAEGASARERARPPASVDPAPWVLVAAGGVLLAGGAVLVGVAAADAATVENGTRWSEIRDAYDRVPILSGAGIAALGAGAVALAVGLGWAVASGGSGTPEVAIGPGAIHLRGRF